MEYIDLVQGGCYGRARYRQIAEDLSRQIESGELSPGEPLPSEVVLREKYEQGKEVSRNTVRDAIKLLISRGLIETRPGQGTFVLRQMVPFVTMLDTNPGARRQHETVYESRSGGDVSQNPHSQARSPPATAALVASQLQLDKGAYVILRHQERKIDRTPWSLRAPPLPDGVRHPGRGPASRG